ncbi:hypothetical protein [Xanthomonas melonis]|nr:hypothetical protein [Xanthomonas melonis]
MRPSSLLEWWAGSAMTRRACALYGVRALEGQGESPGGRLEALPV